MTPPEGWLTVDAVAQGSGAALWHRELAQSSSYVGSSGILSLADEEALTVRTLRSTPARTRFESPPTRR